MSNAEELVGEKTNKALSWANTDVFKFVLLL